LDGGAPPGRNSVLDVILTGGEVYDGSGGLPFKADIGVSRGHIACVGDLSGLPAAERVAVDGLAVSPGFIDLHTHSDFTLLVNGRAESQVHQGVTTEVIGQCGHSCAPLARPQDARASAIGYVDSSGVRFDWQSFGEYLERLEANPLGVNVAAFVGHGAIHRAVMGDVLRTPDIRETKEMASLLAEAFDQGAYGFSTGLEYWPGSICAPEHIVPLCAVAARHDRLYATHVRNRDAYYDTGFAEALCTARNACARLQISHIQPKYGAPAHAMHHTLEMIESATRYGADVAFDVIPHDWNHTTIRAILPPWAQEGGIPATLERLKDPAARERMKANPKHMWLLVTDGRWDDIALLNSEANPDLVGETFSDIARRRNTTPFDAALDLMLEEGEGMRSLMWTSHGFTDDDIELCLQQGRCAVISDTLALAPYGALEKSVGSISGYGWAARFLGLYVRERGVLSLQEAIRRMTSLPAYRLGLPDRGRLQPGLKADITVFDAARVQSRCTMKAPREYPSGIAHVLVNGQFAMREGVRTTVDAGRVLRPA
jgi:N-acyl-D-aspartate/D-glutamate deacylase